MRETQLKQKPKFSDEKRKTDYQAPPNRGGNGPGHGLARHNPYEVDRVGNPPVSVNRPAWPAAGSMSMSNRPCLAGPATLPDLLCLVRVGSFQTDLTRTRNEKT